MSGRTKSGPSAGTPMSESLISNDPPYMLRPNVALPVSPNLNVISIEIVPSLDARVLLYLLKQVLIASCDAVPSSR